MQELVQLLKKKDDKAFDIFVQVLKIKEGKNKNVVHFLSTGDFSENTTVNEETFEILDRHLPEDLETGRWII